MPVGLLLLLAALILAIWGTANGRNTFLGVSLILVILQEILPTTMTIF